jgi:histone H3/H4
MNAFWSKKKDNAAPAAAALRWDEQAKQGIEQAVSQAPVPGLLKGKIRQELMKAAEEETTRAGRTTVTAEDVVAGMLAKMPAAMRDKVTQAMQKGPAGLKDLEQELRNQK